MFRLPAKDAHIFVKIDFVSLYAVS